MQTVLMQTNLIRVYTVDVCDSVDAEVWANSVDEEKPDQCDR